MYAWLDLQRVSYGFDYGSLRSLAGLVLCPAEPLPFASSLPVGTSASNMALSIIVHNIRRGSSSPPSGRQGCSLILETALPLCCTWVGEGPERHCIFTQLQLRPGGGYAGVGSWHGGDDGEANSHNFRRRRLSLPSVSSSTVVAFSLQSHNINS
jgi:hypothetical protein